MLMGLVYRFYCLKLLILLNLISENKKNCAAKAAQFFKKITYLF